VTSIFGTMRVQSQRTELFGMFLWMGIWKVIAAWRVLAGRGAPSGYSISPQVLGSAALGNLDWRIQ